ncbi:MAG: caspase family protein [Bacteroidota bacterium]|jgi:hypothetical protein
MRKVVEFLAGLFLVITMTDAQGVTGRSNAGSFSSPEKLSATLRFIGHSGGNTLGAGEVGTLLVTVSNTGGTTARSVVVSLSTTSTTSRIRFIPSFTIPQISPAGADTARFELSAPENAPTQTIPFMIEVADAKGIKSETQSMTISTKEKPVVRDVTPPAIEVTEPVIVTTRGMKIPVDSAAFHTDSSSLVVKGLATDSSGVALVLVNGQEAQLSLTGGGTSFSDNVLLVLGNNEIEIRAVDKFRNEASLKFLVKREPRSLVQKTELPSVFKGQRWAVVVGISHYADSDIPQLRYADNDAQAFYAVTTTPIEEGGLGVPKSNARFLVNEQATSAHVREAITDFLKAAIEDDIVFIYFAGHGAPDPERPKVLYLLTHDSQLNKLASTSIKMQEIQDALHDYVAAKRVLVFADACHSRGVSGEIASRALAAPDLVNEYLEEIARSRESSISFSASDVNQLSQEDKKWGGGHGVFTYYILEALKGKADFDHDKIIRLGELTQYVSDHVRRDTKAQQSPISSGSFDVNLPLTVVP